ncbi:MAG TPA: sigma-70 family RNA polymerase sigma factor [Polyangiaceae bacterium]|jgi:RNA polymerase sigma factor (sigma-70 family)|nr:sigma-70 family RNA polymerase sigma factor [Polyangiaceae bacterium]
MRVSPQERWTQFMGNAKSLRAYIRRRVCDATEAEEVFQELSLIVIRDRSESDDIEQFAAWYRALARNVLARYFRTERRRADLLNRVGLETASSSLTHAVDPERSASAREILRTLDTSLEPRARELLLQRYLLGESAGEIAMKLEESPAAVRVRLMRLRSLVRRKSPGPP